MLYLIITIYIIFSLVVFISNNYSEFNTVMNIIFPIYFFLVEDQF